MQNAKCKMILQAAAGRNALPFGEGASEGGGRGFFRPRYRPATFPKGEGLGAALCNIPRPQGLLRHFPNYTELFRKSKPYVFTKSGENWGRRKKSF